jgi:chlorobactene glucosyltransferase
MDMLIGLVLVAITFDLLLYFKLFWQFRYVLLIFSTAFLLAAFSIATGYFDLLYAAILGLVFFFRLIAIARVYKNRLHQAHLKQVSQQSLLALNLTLLVVVLLGSYVAITVPSAVVELLVALQAGFSIMLFAFVTNSIVQTRYHGNLHHYSDKELPTLTVAIPARNETDDLKECIDTILSSDYPKLEVLVLDDCSQGKKPPSIIKHHAHAGVRFLQGTPPPDNWLAKNHAYQQLADEATGDYILFCGVDVRMSTTYLRNIITHIKYKKKRMLSVLPVRYHAAIFSSFVQPMRYWWELALPRKFLNKPAVLSTCWVIQKKVLQRLGGFHAVKKSIVPERYFARECVSHDSYSFLRANEELDLHTTKKLIDQVQTAYRVRYPQFRSRIESVLLYISVLTLVFILPYVFAIGAWLIGNEFLFALSLISIIFLTVSHVLIVTVSQPSNSLMAIINLPFVVLSEISLTTYSMLQYEFGEVIWKGRNICLPILSENYDAVAD